MILHSHSWGDPAAEAVVCVHGIGQSGVVFKPLAEQLSRHGHFVISVDLRGHGASTGQPPWTLEAHADDLLETIAASGVSGGTWIGHSFGGLVVATVAERAARPVRRIALLDPGMAISPDRARRGAEIEAMDWSFASIDSAVNALMSSEAVVATPRAVVEAYARDHLRPDADGRFRFRYSASAASAAWLELQRPAPRIAEVPTLIVRPATGLIDGSSQDARYVETLGDLVRVVNVPNGHNVLWESPEETVDAVQRFMAET